MVLASLVAEFIVEDQASSALSKVSTEVDETGTAFQEAMAHAGNFNAGLQKATPAIEETSSAFQEAASHAQTFGTGLDDQIPKTTSFGASIGGLAKSFTGAGYAIDHVDDMFDRFEMTEMSVDNANLRLEKSQEAYNKALIENGAGSAEAEAAARNLEIATNRNEMANIRAKSSMVLIGLQAVTLVSEYATLAEKALLFAGSGTVIATSTKAISAGLAAAQVAASGFSTALLALLANPVVLTLAAIAAAAIALKYAWDNNWGGIQEKTASAVADIKGEIQGLQDYIDNTSSLSKLDQWIRNQTAPLDMWIRSLTGSLNENKTAMGENTSTSQALAIAQKVSADLTASAAQQEDNLYHMRVAMRPLQEELKSAEEALTKTKADAVAADKNLADAEKDYNDAKRAATSATKELDSAEDALAKVKADMVAEAASANLAEKEKEYNYWKQASKDSAKELEIAEKTLTDARKDLIAYTKDLDNAEDALNGSVLDARSAKLDLKDAEENLNKVRKDSKSTTEEVERAEISLERAKLRVEQSSETQAENETKLSEVKTSAATRSDNLKNAEVKLSVAKENVDDASTLMKISEENLNDAKLAATPTTNKLGEAEARVKTAKDAVSKASSDLKVEEDDLKYARIDSMVKGLELRKQEEDIAKIRAELKIKTDEADAANLKLTDTNHLLAEANAKVKLMQDGANKSMGEAPAAFGAATTCLIDQSDTINTLAIPTWGNYGIKFGEVTDTVKQPGWSIATVKNIDDVSVKQADSAVKSGTWKDETLRYFGLTETGIGTTLDNISTKIHSVWDGIYTYLFGASVIPDIYNGFVDYFGRIKDWLFQKLTDISSDFTNIWTQIKTGLFQKLTDINSDIVNIWTTTKNWLFQKLTDINSDFVNVWSAIKNWLFTKLTDINSDVVNVWTKTKDWLFQKLTDIKGDVYNIWGAIKTTVDSFMDSIYNKVTSTWSSIKSSVQSMYDTINGWYNSAVSAYNKLVNLSNTPVPMPSSGGGGGGARTGGSGGSSGSGSSGSAPYSPYFGLAEGGSFWTQGATPLVVGEGNEPEYVSVVPLSKMTSNGNTYVFNNYAPIYSVSDLKRTWESFMKESHRSIKSMGG